MLALELLEEEGLAGQKPAVEAALVVEHLVLEEVVGVEQPELVAGQLAPELELVVP